MYCIYKISWQPKFMIWRPKFFCSSPAGSRLKKLISSPDSQFPLSKQLLLILVGINMHVLALAPGTILLPMHPHPLSQVHMFVILRQTMSKCFYLCKAFSIEVCFGNKGLPGARSPGTGGFCLIPEIRIN